MNKFTDEERTRIIAELPQPEDKLAKWRRENDEQDKRFAKERAVAARARNRNTAPDWSAEIARQIAAERVFLIQQLGDFLGEYVAEQLAQERKAFMALADQFHTMRVELADARADIAELRIALATERSKALDLPNPLARRPAIN
jgi:hypothetical protein